MFLNRLFYGFTVSGNPSFVAKCDRHWRRKLKL